MILSTLIRKGGLEDKMTTTVATGATVSGDSTLCVATVAVAPSLESLPELSPDEERRIRTWLAYIEEDDPVIIDEYLNKCRKNEKHRQYFLMRAEEVPKMSSA